MELNIKFDEKMIVETANKVLDEYEYNGKTIRDWADLIVNPKTNADRIRSMSDEELAEFMKPYDSGCPRWKEMPIPCSKRTNCRECWLDWLREEVTE